MLQVLQLQPPGKRAMGAVENGLGWAGRSLAAGPEIWCDVCPSGYNWMYVAYTQRLCMRGCPAAFGHHGALMVLRAPSAVSLSAWPQRMCVLPLLTFCSTTRQLRRS
jgi:hypothetical protein